MRSTHLFISSLLMLALATPAFAQNREGTWEFEFDVNWQSSYDLDFDGGSTASTDSDFGFSIGADYHFTNQLALQFLFDWLRVDYESTVVSANTPPLPSYNVRGTMEIYTPRVNGVYHFIDGPITPYVSAGIGWAFVDTNIPNGPPQIGCWWDPWYGQICTGFQDTKNTDAFTYALGAGVRWDMSPAASWRLGYEKQWYDVGKATSTPGFDQVRLGFGYRF